MIPTFCKFRKKFKIKLKLSQLLQDAVRAEKKAIHMTIMVSDFWTVLLNGTGTVDAQQKRAHIG